VGVWIETVKPDINWELDPATMPFEVIPRFQTRQ
jgi:hypothetical protein